MGVFLEHGLNGPDVLPPSRDDFKGRGSVGGIAADRFREGKFSLTEEKGVTLELESKRSCCECD